MKIPIKRYVMDKNVSWEERYRQLERHHEEETTWMITEIKRLEAGGGTSEGYKVQEVSVNPVSLDDPGAVKYTAYMLDESGQRADYVYYDTREEALEVCRKHAGKVRGEC